MSGLPILVRTFGQGSKLEIRLAIDSFNNEPWVDVRTWEDFVAGPVSGRGPTKRGVSFPIADLPDLVAAIGEAESMALDLGLLNQGRTKTA